MSWSVAVFTAVSIEAAKAEIDEQLKYLKKSDPDEAVWVRKTFADLLDHLGRHPDMHLSVRGTGHRYQGTAGGNVSIEILPVWPPKGLA